MAHARRHRQATIPPQGDDVTLHGYKRIKFIVLLTTIFSVCLRKSKHKCILTFEPLYLSVAWFYDLENIFEGHETKTFITEQVDVNKSPS